METVKEERGISDNFEDLEVNTKSMQDEISDSDTEQLSGSGNFQRGSKMTRSLGRSFKNLDIGRSGSRAWAPSVESVSDGKSGSFFVKLFSSKSKKDTHKETILLLQKELDDCKDQVKNDLTQLDHFRRENKRLKDENAFLKDKDILLEEEMIKLKTDDESLRKWNEQILFSVGQALKSYGETFEKFDLDDFSQRDENFRNVDNLQIGSGNIQNIFNADMKLLSKYHKHLENIMHEWKLTKENLQITKAFQEQMGNKILTLESVLEEVKGALLDVRNTKKQEVSVELLDYTISWTYPRLMAECVDELQTLPERSEDYLFKDLEGKAKIGVLRIFKKYGQKMNLKRFVQKLEMEEYVSENKMSSDSPLEKDDCASLLVKWVKLHEENDANALVEMFPRIKPGRMDTRPDRFTGIQFPNVSYSTDSLNSNDDLTQRTEQFRERLMKELRDIVQHEIHTLKPELEEIKMAVTEKGAEP